MGFFRAPSPPPMPTYIPPAPVAAPPTEDNSAEKLAEAAEQEKQRAAKQRGRAATLLSGSGQGVLGDDSSQSGGLATKKLLGG